MSTTIDLKQYSVGPRKEFLVWPGGAVRWSLIREVVVDLEEGVATIYLEGGDENTVDTLEDVKAVLRQLAEREAIVSQHLQHTAPLRHLVRQLHQGRTLRERVLALRGRRREKDASKGAPVPPAPEQGEEQP